MLAVVISVWGFLAFAETAKEDTIPPDIRLTSYGDSYVIERYIPSPVKFNVPPMWTWNNCVESAKYITGRQGEHWGNARDIKSNSSVPIVGGFGLTTEGGGHMFVVQDIIDDKVQTVECNYIHGQCTHRIVSIRDPKIRGWVLPSGP